MAGKERLFELVKALAQAQGEFAQLDILARYIRDLPPQEAAELLNQLCEDPAASPSHAKAFLSVLDILRLESTAVKSSLIGVVEAARKMPEFDRMLAKLRTFKNLDKRSRTILKAKVALVLQVLFSMGERMEEDGKPKPTLKGSDILELITAAAASDPMLLRIPREKFPPIAQPYLTEDLQESDFREVSQGLYEFRLSEAAIKRYAEGSALVSLTADRDSKAAELMIARMGEHLIRRLVLLIRGMHMYSPDHPAVQPIINSLRDSVMRFLEHKDKVTITRMGTEFLVDDIKIKKKARYITDLSSIFEEYNISSITFFKGLKDQDLKQLGEIFTLSTAQLKRRGGVKGELEHRKVRYVAVDQFKYGLVSDEGQPVVSDADRALEGLILTEVITRMKEGKDISGLSPEEFSAAFRDILEGKFEASDELRKNLAQMLLGADPELADMLMITDPALREKISWSAAQSILGQLLQDLKSKGKDVVSRAAQSLKQILKMAISREKETSIRDIVEGTSKALWANRSNPDAELYILDLIAYEIQELIASDRVDVAHIAIEQLNQFVAFADEIARSISQPNIRRMSEAAKRAFESIITERTINTLIGQLTSEDSIVSERAAKILKSFKKTETAEALFKLFLQPDRAIRRLALEIMIALGEPAKAAALRRIDSINNTDMFPRNDDGRLEDDAWFELRNAMEIVAQLGNQKERERMLKLMSDPDPRVRREVLTIGMRINPEASKLLALKHISDEVEVAKTAIGILGALKNEDDLDLLFYHFQKRPDLREAIIQAVGSIGGEKAESFLLSALRSSPYKSVERIFYDSPNLVICAIKALKQAGREASIQALEAFVERYKNPIKRALLMPVRKALKSDELITVAQDTLNSLKLRCGRRTSEQTDGQTGGSDRA